MTSKVMESTRGAKNDNMRILRFRKSPNGRWVAQQDGEDFILSVDSADPSLDTDYVCRVIDIGKTQGTMFEAIILKESVPEPPINHQKARKKEILPRAMTATV